MNSVCMMFWGNVFHSFGAAILKAHNQLGEPRQYPKQCRAKLIPEASQGLTTSRKFPTLSLTSCVCKLLERMVHHRLMWFL